MGQYIYGNASYYTSCNGSNGACAPNYPCNNSSYHIAYSNVNVDWGCGIPQRSCNSVVYIWDYCKSKGSYASIRDQNAGSTQSSCNSSTYCNNQSNNDPNFGKPIVDMTEALFRYVHGDLSDGRIKVSVYLF